MTNYRWFTPKEREVYRRHMALERSGTALIRAADPRRKRAAAAPSTAKPAAIMPAAPQRYTLSDLATLRKQGRVP